MLRSFEHPVACCWESLRKFETGQAVVGSWQSLEWLTKAINKCILAIQRAFSTEQEIHDFSAQACIRMDKIAKLLLIVFLFVSIYLMHCSNNSVSCSKVRVACKQALCKADAWRG